MIHNSCAVRGAAAALVSAAILSGCGASSPMQDAEGTRDAVIDATAPSSSPVRTITGFSDALSCMDEMFLNYGKREIVITSNGVTDATQEISAGTRDMLITAIARMSRRSNAFSYVDYEPGSSFGQKTDIDTVTAQRQEIFNSTQLLPNFYIRGSITQFDEGALNRAVGAGLSVPGIGKLGGGIDDTVSTISVDVNIGEVFTRRILNDTTASNTIAVRRQQQATDGRAEGVLSGNPFGASFNFSITRREGMHTALRNLLELSLIESLGKFTQVPYWRCLNIEQTNPAARRQVREWYDGMSERERLVFVQRALGGGGYYTGPADGRMNDDLADAIGRYARAEGILADGRVTFDLYNSLVAGDLNLGAEEAPDAPTPARMEERFVGITAQLVPEKDVYPPEEAIQLSVMVEENGYLYCYYADADNSVYRIYPNRYAPNALVPKRQRVTIPGSNEIKIIPLTPNTREEIRCYASSQEIGLLLPTDLKARDLEPLPIGSLDALAGEFARRASQPIDEERLVITVGDDPAQ